MSVARVPLDLPTAPVQALVEAPTDAPVVEAVAHGRVRRLIELTVATGLLVALLPVLVVVALLVAGTSRGPVLYRQRRVGVGGRPFEIVKFRTMRRDAEVQAAALFAQRNDGSGPLTKIHADPRVTRVGRVLRRFSLDELPQLWNVLNGTMALVGPRPTTPAEVARFADRDHHRHAVRPGITGISQVSGRSDLAWEDAVAMDLHYVASRSLRLDLEILLRTLPAVVRGRGAY
jgi:lipopolysaccharide/colanic/teichoic acid biosynthesis glycosyltransferase